MLRAWLRSRFASQTDIDDIVQEAFVRVLKARASGEVRSPRAFLFVTARNIALMQLRHRAVAREDSLTESELWDILDESVDVPQAVARAQELELLTRAIQSLPGRCREVFTLRTAYGLTQRQIADKLGVSLSTVEKQFAQGIRLCAIFFANGGR